MFWFLVILALALLICGSIVINVIFDLDAPFLGLLLILIVLGAGWGIFQLIGYGNSQTAVRNGNAVELWSQETDLRALNTNSAALEGRTFLTMGYVEGNRVYTFIRETDDGGFVLETRELDSAIVYEVDGLEQPYVRESRHRGDLMWTWTSVPGRTEFYVPTGSVQDEAYDVSIEGKVG